MKKERIYFTYTQAAILSVFAFLILCVATVFLWQNSREHVVSQAKIEFDQETELIIAAIENRTNLYVNALTAGVSFLEASDLVTREDWRIFVEQLRLQENYPGIQGYGYSVFIPPEQKDSHIARIRAEGFPSYTIRPAGERPTYTSIVYLEPFDIRNQQAFGYDMFSEETRRSAMEQARDTGQPRMSGRVTLVQEIDEDLQAGFLIYVPTYKRNTSPQSVEGRRSFIEGYVYSPFRAKDFMSGILGNRDIKVDFAVYDGVADVPNDDKKMYANFDTSTKPFDQRIFSKKETISVGNHTWTLTFSSRQGYWQEALSAIPQWEMLFFGLILSLAVSGVIFSLLVSQVRIKGIVQRVTGDLENFKLAVDSATDGISMMDTNMHIVYVNPAWQQMTGYTLEEVLGKTPEVVKNTKTERGLYSVLLAKIKSGHSFVTEELSNVTKEGNEYPVQLAMYPIKKNEEIVYFVGVEQDITKRKEVDRAKTEFVSLASHQLRTPLTAVEWNTELLLTEQSHNLSEEQMGSLVQIQNGTKQMIQLVDSLLDTSRIELGTFTANPVPTNVQSLSENVLNDFQVLIDQKDIALRVQYDVQEDSISIDQQIVHMVLQNLLSNAFKYTPDAGSVRLHIKTENKLLHIKVTDTGYGIPVSARDKVFSKLFRAKNITSLDVGGTGLGLYLVKSMVTVLGGTIDFVSEEGGGSTFFVEIPYH